MGLVLFAGSSFCSWDTPETIHGGQVLNPQRSGFWGAQGETTALSEWVLWALILNPATNL